MSEAPAPAPTTAVDADRDPLTAAAVIVLLGMLSALERGEAVATACNAVDDGAEWSLQLKLAEVQEASTASTTTTTTTKLCPLCRQPGFETKCKHCDFVDD